MNAGFMILRMREWSLSRKSAQRAIDVMSVVGPNKIASSRALTKRTLCKKKTRTGGLTYHLTDHRGLTEVVAGFMVDVLEGLCVIATHRLSSDPCNTCGRVGTANGAHLGVRDSEDVPLGCTTRSLVQLP